MTAPDAAPEPPGAPTALAELAAAIRADDTLLSAHLSEPTAAAALGALAAAGPRAQGAEREYAFVFEAVREGYLLHYGEPRLLAGVEADLALLAGDHLYALGLERLAGLGDLEAVRELADLISLSALVHTDGDATANAADPATAKALWLAAASAVAAGASPAHEAAKAALRERGPGDAATAALAAAGRETAANEGFESAWGEAADSIDFDLPSPPARG